MRTLPEVGLIRGFKRPADLRAGGAGESLRRMIKLMPTQHRRLIEMVIVNHQSHRAAGTELGIVPGVVSRRVRALRNRLACPVRRALATHLDTLPEPTRGLAINHWFAGVPRTELARDFNLSLREVQAQLDYVLGWIRALNRRRLAEKRLLALHLSDHTDELDPLEAR